MKSKNVKNHMLYAPFICEESDLFVQRKKENHGMGALFNGHIGMFIRGEGFVTSLIAGQRFIFWGCYPNFAASSLTSRLMRA